MWSTFEGPSLNIAKHLSEDTTLLKSITSTATCPFIRTETAEHLLESRTSAWKGAVEKQIAGKWHVVILQEAVEYVGHDLLTNRFHVTHYGECAVLFNKDTFFLDVKVKSIFLHDIRSVLPDKVVKGKFRLVLQGVASERRLSLRFVQQ